MPRIFGHIPGYKEGCEFQSRLELSLSGVHAPRQAGISGGQREGADSIVLSGGMRTMKTTVILLFILDTEGVTRSRESRSLIKNW